jgi:hypothetical protein
MLVDETSGFDSLFGSSRGIDRSGLYKNKQGLRPDIFVEFTSGYTLAYLEGQSEEDAWFWLTDNEGSIVWQQQGSSLKDELQIAILAEQLADSGQEMPGSEEMYWQTTAQGTENELTIHYDFTLGTGEMWDVHNSKGDLLATYYWNDEVSPPHIGLLDVIKTLAYPMPLVDGKPPTYREVD